MIIERDVSLPDGSGCDDYITKPFKLAVFLSRINALLRRLRTKIEDHPEEPEKIVTVRRMGYKWKTAD